MSVQSPSILSGEERNDAFASDFKCAVGGLRRVLGGCVIKKEEYYRGDSTATELSLRQPRTLLYDTLLRPGRLEVQLEIPLLDREGRTEILDMNVDTSRKKRDG
mmetsp:Transcript_44665/g.67304  ORF Transcript_44665/g.67304 Transcript_44665/m.67304 type:complete len:104 (+) Transcript_44665:25-336(+)